MSQQNVETVQRSMEHYGATGDHLWEAIDARVEVYDHDIPDAGVYVGHEGVRAWLEDWGAAWSAATIEPQRWIDAGDRVVVVLDLTATGRGSGVEVKRRDAMVWTVRDGKTIRIDYFNNEAQALDAVRESGQLQDSV
jgi:ketosteroid isomerase-like protein